MIWLKTIIQRKSARGHGDTIDRVIAIDRTDDIVVTFDIQNIKALPIKESYQALQSEVKNGQAKILLQDPFKQYIGFKDSDVNPRLIKKRDDAFMSIEDLVTNHKWELFDQKTRGKLIRGAAKKFKKEYQEILNRLRLYWQMGMHINALYPNYRNTGIPGWTKPVTEHKRGRRTELEKATNQRIGINVTNEDAIKLGKGYRTYYLKSDGKYSEEEAYNITLRRFYRKRGLKGTYEDLPPKEKLPTLRQFRYWGRKYISTAERIRLRSGERNYPLTKRPRIHTTKKIYFGPGAEFQIDATRFSVYLVSRRNRHRIIGTPVVYIIRDSWSRMIVSFAVTLEGPSWLGAILALETMTTDKVKLCKKYGILIDDWEWPCKQLCFLIRADRGELLSKQALRLVKHLNVFKSNTPAFRGDLKGLVENTFNVIQDVVDWLPGAYYDRSERKGPDYRLDGKMNIDEFTKLIIGYILKYNNEKKIDGFQLEPAMVADGIKPIPLDLWNWGIENLTGELRTEDQEFVRFCLLPEGKGSISRDGIYFKKIWYTSNDPQMWEKFHEANQGRIAVKIIYDPRCVDMIYVRLDKTGESIQCSLRDDYQVHQGCTFEEYADELSIHDQEDQIDADRQLRAEVKYQDLIDTTIRQAEERYAESVDPSMNKSEQISGSAQNRKDERTDLRHQEAWLSENRNRDTSNDETETEETYIPKHSPHEDLRKLLEENKKEKQYEEQQ